MFLLRTYKPFERQYRLQFQSKLSKDNNKNEDHFSWTFPPFRRIYTVYNVISNILLSWVFLKYLSPGLFADLGRLLATMIGMDATMADENCYVYGRFVLHFELPTESVGCMLASLHLTWRLAQEILYRPSVLDVLLFAMQPEDKVEVFIEKLKGNCKQELSEYEHFLRHIMCHKVTYHKAEGEKQARIIYRLRPNRTLTARKSLVHKLAQINTRGLVIFIILVVSFTCYIASAVFFNQRRYPSAYPNCDVQLTSRMLKEDNFTTWSVPQLAARPHYVTTVLFDSIENAIVWVDSGLAMVGSYVFMIFLNNDLFAYWTHLRHQINELDAESKHTSICLRELAADSPERSRMLLSITTKVHDLQQELCDFFHQINQVDSIISDIITYGLFIWLGAFGCATFEVVAFYSSDHNSSPVIVVTGILTFAFVCNSAVAATLLSLQRSCKLSYTKICSIMAHNQTSRKRHFMRILDFYTQGNRTCYTLFQLFPYSSSNFASSIVWSATCFLVVDSIFHRR